MTPVKLINFWRAESGAAAVEFAIVAPLLLLLFAGFVEFGNLFYQQQQLEKSVRDAARYLSYYDQNPSDSDYAPWATTSPGQVCSSGSSPSTIEDAADNLILYGSVCTGTTPIVTGMTASQITITSGSKTITAAAGTCTGNSCTSCSMTIPTVTVSVQTPYSDVIGLLWFLGMSNITLSTTYTERVLPDFQGSLEACTS